jgi:hypothetical protein
VKKRSKGTLQFITFNPKKIVLEPELEQMFSDCQRELEAASAGGYHPEDRAQIEARHILGDDIYVRQAHMPKWNGTVSMLREPKVAIRYAVAWGISTSKSDHAQKADFFDNLAQKMDDEWNSTVNLAVEIYGEVPSGAKSSKGSFPQGTLISGVYRDHFPESVKQRLRFLTAGKNLASSACRLHMFLSKTRSPLFS